MIDMLGQIDRSVFLFLNQTLANPVTDWVMPILTNDMFLRVLFVIVMLSLLGFGKKRFIWVVIFAGLVVALTDQTSSAWLKPALERLRPCKVMEVHLLVGCGSGYSMPSSHAANLFGQAFFFGLLYRASRYPLFVFATLVALSRVFVGVHYPFDILVGASIGSIIGIAMALALKYLSKRNLLRPLPYLEHS
jgi:undecaprenyl-diphosphatase